jgi:hypothetical protein
MATKSSYKLKPAIKKVNFRSLKSSIDGIVGKDVY